MKKLIVVSALALSLATNAAAQNVNVNESVAIEDFSIENVCGMGVSPDGRIVYGNNLGGKAVFYNLDSNDPMTMIESGPEDQLKLGLTVAGITNDGRALICDYLNTYFIDFTDMSKTFIQSPDPAYGVNTWDISNDGKIMACNLTSTNFVVIPMVGRLQEDGSYKLEYLEYDEKDAMGCYAQYTQTRYVSEDGKFIFGIQPDDRGMGGRLVVWVLQEDGSYKFTTPLDEYLYDFTYEKPGFAPEENDYITADPEKDPDLYNKQCEEFDNAFMEYEENYANFTRNYSELDVYGLHKASNSNMACMGFRDYRGEKSGLMTPVFYDAETNTITEYPDITSDSFAWDELPGGGYIVANKLAEICSLTAVDKSGEKMPFEKWFLNVTGTDIAKDFTYTFMDPMTYEEVTGVYPGRPYFSANGKTLLFSGMNPETGDFTASVYCFDSNIFEIVPTGMKVNVVNKVLFDGSVLELGSGSHGTAVVYGMNGSELGSYDVNGNINFEGVLHSGSYIVKTTVDGKAPVSMKICVK